MNNSNGVLVDEFQMTISRRQESWHDMDWEYQIGGQNEKMRILMMLDIK